MPFGTVTYLVLVFLLFTTPAIYIVFVVNRLPIRSILLRRRPRPLDEVHPAAVVRIEIIRIISILDKSPFVNVPNYPFRPRCLKANI